VSLNTEIHIKLRFSIQRAMKAHREEYRYSRTPSLTSALDEVSGERHAPVVLPPGE